jgi:hypothetical protein
MVDVMTQDEVPAVLKSTAVQAAVLIALAALLGNVNAIVDSILHPEIPYFDPEHLVVGGATAFVATALSMVLLLYLRRLRKATATIDRLVALLPICANCKRIRKAGVDPHAQESWQTIESYITETTGTEFSHGICPKCSAELYPEQGHDHGK